MNPKYSKTLVILVMIIILYKAFTSYIFPGKPPIEQIIIRDESGKETEKVKISVYYEALCPDSKFFIIYQLVPVFERLKDFLIIDLVPYGKAQTTVDDNGNIEFICQHDHVECYANKIHACVIDQVEDVENQLKYIACMITDNMVPEDAGKRCGHEHNIDFAPVNKCATEQKGSILLKKFGERTHDLSPRVKFVPTIELNESQTFESQASILKDLLRAVCNVYQTKPEVCTNL
ncbi:gamma-interferon-inducible lysosomal thiol reductase-like [Sitophilus oryzae]|uniref:Gamma-interferon-inducible lysosomal thiol reductase-like n=1 Tax=Sitophilus oryzae TaxID=7048 RepID=A0A6J2XAW0_SITOR|nr:gamma-interferon-inducible lysosomal thiol reductase-like [Sitophilus oryzae]